jgi:pyochelin biosynthetic protein PchC
VDGAVEGAAEVASEGAAERSGAVVGLGDDDPDVEPDEMRPWCEVTAGPMTLHVFPGDHFYLIEQRDAVLKVAAEHLDGDGEPTGTRARP